MLTELSTPSTLRRPTFLTVRERCGDYARAIFATLTGTWFLEAHRRLWRRIGVSWRMLSIAQMNREVMDHDGLAANLRMSSVIVLVALAAAPLAGAPPVVPRDVHWSFRPIEKPTLPRVSDDGWCRTPIDRFVFAKLSESSLHPSRDADRRTWLRRATFNLRGMSPTPDEVRDFENDHSPDAYPRAVDRLLAEPQYGERWARHWLDVARYADTRGAEAFADREYRWAYTYRDYVIESFNEDRPFDQFVREQIAADRLHATGETDTRALRALGFLTVGPRFMNDTHNVIDDRIDVVTRGFLGLTVSCARCHDHKYDPVPTEDYYSLYGVFASSAEPSILPLFEDPADTEEYRDFDAEFKERIGKLNEYIDSKYRGVIVDARTRIAGYLLAAHEADKRPSTLSFMFVVDPGDLNPYTIQRWQAFLQERKKTADPVFAAWHAFTAVAEDAFESKAPQVIDQLRQGDTHALVLQALMSDPPRSLQEVANIYERVLRAPTFSVLSRPDLGALTAALYGPGTPADIPPPGAGLSMLWIFPDRASQGVHSGFFGPVIEWLKSGPGAPPRAMVLTDRPAPVEPRVFQRGNPTLLGPRVPRRFLGALSGEDREPFRDGSGRLELARAIASPENPLTARVLVNRVWMHHFGNPLVATPDDFGMRSDEPTHSKLLDWLAASFIDSGWSIKWLHREILLSSVFRQASENESDASTLDPENNLLGRMNRRRLDFEATRDALLNVSGSLVRRIGGPSSDVLASRRTVYTRIDRDSIPGLLCTFDFPDPQTFSARRVDTTVAPQALFFMNHPFVIDRAKEVLRREGIADAPTIDVKIDRLYALLFQRRASADERDMGRAFLTAPRNQNPLYTDWSYGFARLSPSEEAYTLHGFDVWTGARFESPGTPVYLEARWGEPHAQTRTAVVRRWTSRVDGEIRIAGTLHQPAGPETKEKVVPDGVRARVISSSRSTVATWDALAVTIPTDLDRFQVSKGETLDFVVDGKEDGTNDRFEWTVTLRENEPGEHEQNDTSGAEGVREWISQVDFRGSQASPAVQYVQALLMLNEFIFVD
jgi:hypothetical protein